LVWRLEDEQVEVRSWLYLMHVLVAALENQRKVRRSRTLNLSQAAAFYEQGIQHIGM